MTRLGTFTAGLDLAALVDASPFPFLLLSTAHVILGANDAYLRATRRTRADIVGRNLFDTYPPDPGAQDPSGAEIVRASLARAQATRQPDHLAIVHINIPVQTAEGTVFEERYWSAIHAPVLDAQGEVAFLFQSPVDVTELVRLQQAGQGRPVQEDLDYQIAGSVFSRAQAREAANRRLDRERMHLLNLFKQAPGFVAVVRGPQHVVEMVNESCYELVGRRDIVGKCLLDALPELAQQDYARVLDRVFREGKPFVGRPMRVLLQRHPDAPPAERYLDVVFQPVTGADEETAGIFIEGHDVTEQKHAQDALRVSNERLRLAVEGTGDGIWDWDMETDDVLYSGRFRDMFGYDEQEFPSRYDAWESRVHPEDLPRVLAAIDTGVRTREPVAAEYRFRCRDGKWKWVRSRAILVAHDAHQKPSRMIGTITDISDEKQSDELFWRQANFDMLTGLPNRRLFRDRLEQEVKQAQRLQFKLALLFIDLDRFKEVNDLLGHDTGDQLLAQAARRLTGCVRESDTVARLGGDEFTVILSGLHDATHVEQAAQKILQALAQPFFLNQQTLYVSGSIGITLCEPGAASAEQMISNADQAMYAAKHAGRNQFRYFTRSMQETAHRRLRLGHDLRNALAAEQLQVHYQPVVELASGRIVKAEALLRWNHPTLGMVAPAQFIPIAEETGLINDLGDWVFKQAAACSRKWQRQLGRTVQVSVNASPAQFHSAEQGIDWLKYLEMLGLLGSAVVVEITEGLLLNASPAVAARLFEYRDGGIQVAIDDFGTGYSSMQYLKKFDIDYLKIDQSFVADMVNDASDRTIVKSIIVMAHELGLQVIAEGIETAAQRDLLRDAGCDFGQGYLFAKALSADEFGRLMEGERK